MTFEVVTFMVSKLVMSLENKPMRSRLIMFMLCECSWFDVWTFLVDWWPWSPFAFFWCVLALWVGWWDLGLLLLLHLIVLRLHLIVLWLLWKHLWHHNMPSKETDFESLRSFISPNPMTFSILIKYLPFCLSLFLLSIPTLFILPISIHILGIYGCCLFNLCTT